MTAHYHTHLAGLLATIILAISTLISGCAQMPSLDDGVSKASQLFEQGNYDGVIALLQPMADRDPNLSTTSLDLLGLAYYHTFNYRQAAAILERATAPGLFSGIPFGGRRINMRNNGVLGWSYFHMHDGAHAMVAFNKALAKSDFRREPAWDESALRGRGWTRYFNGDFQGAASDMTAAQHLAKTNPGINTPNDDYDRHLAMAYASLGLQKDQEAEKLAHAAEAVAKQTKIPPQIVRRNLAPIYLMLGQRDQAYTLYGSKALLGIEMQDFADGTSQGVLVVKTGPDTPAQQAGIVAGDRIVAVDGQAIANAQELARQIGSRSAGLDVQLSVVRNGSPIQLTATLAAPDTLIAAHDLMKPVLKVRSLPALPANNRETPPPASLPATPPTATATIPPEPAGTSTVVIELPSPGNEPLAPQVETPMPPQLRINSIQVEPDPVPAGESFQVKMAVYVLDQDVREATVGVILRYTISKNGKVMARFDPGSFQVPNGVPSPLSFTTRATKTPGDYLIRTELEMGSLKAQAETPLAIR